MTSMESTDPPPHDNKHDDSDNHDDNNDNDSERKHHREGVVVMKKQKKHRHHNDNDDYNDDEDDEVAKKKKREKKKKKKKKKHQKKRTRSSSASSSDDSDDDVDDDDAVERSERRQHDTTATATTQKPPQLQNHDHEERQERRRRARAALMESKFGYTAEENPFHDPNLTDTFVWNKKKQVESRRSETASRSDKETTSKQKKKKTNTLSLMDEIDKVRERRQQREEQKMELERIRAQESRMKEYEHYDLFQQKEEVFHYQQQKIRSAIRLMQHREKPIDIFAKQILLFGGLNNNNDRDHDAATTKYQETYNVLDLSRETLEVEMEEPYLLLKSLTYEELQELSRDIAVFSQLERDAAASTTSTHTTDPPTTTLLQYWENLAILTRDEMKYLQPSSSKNEDHAKMVQDIGKIFVDQSISSLNKMKDDITAKLQQNADPSYDQKYWTNVQEQICVYVCRQELSQLHAQMLTRQLQRLEQKRVELLSTTTTTTNTANTTNATTTPEDHPNGEDSPEPNDNHPPDATTGTIPANVPVEMLDDLEEELGLAQEVVLRSDAPQRDNNEQYRSRKPRYYNRVKSGYDWSKYNQTHYDRDNPPPKIVQGYKFNIFYPDLINPLITPQFTLEPVVPNGVVSRDYCIIRFRAGPPYEDLAFQIVNREWNRSRKRGYKCTFERGVLSLYFNFTTHWYRK